jgi:hypothetical protein
MPGPHGFAVRFNIGRLRAADRSRAFRQPALPSRVTPNAAASTASHPAFVTIAIRPSCRVRRQIIAGFSFRKNRNIFAKAAGQAGQIRFWRRVPVVGAFPKKGSAPPIFQDKSPGPGPIVQIAAMKQFITFSFAAGGSQEHPRRH